MIRIRSVAFAFLAVLPGFAPAADLDYDYLDIAYSRPTLPPMSNPHGYVLDGSYDVAKGFFLLADYSHQSGDSSFGPSNTGTFSDYLLGAGWHYGLSGSTDLVTRLAYAHAEIEPGLAPSASSSGYDIGVGIRFAFVDKLELEAYLDHDTAGNVVQHPTPLLTITYSPDMSGNILSGALRYAFDERFGVGLEYDHSSGYSTIFPTRSHRWLLSGRWYY